MSPRAQPFAAKWHQFARLDYTSDMTTLRQRPLWRVLQLPYVGVIIPIDDPAVVEQLVAWQDALRSFMAYDPQPVDKLHITVHYLGALRQRPWYLLPYSWRRASLPDLSACIEQAVRSSPPFDVRIGPLNAFPNALIAEVHECERRCLRMLRANIRRALPLRARPPAPWSYLPHITLGLWGTQDVAPIVEALRPYRDAEPLTFRVTCVKFTVYTRDDDPLDPHYLKNASEELIGEFELSG